MQRCAMLDLQRYRRHFYLISNVEDIVVFLGLKLIILIIYYAYSPFKNVPMRQSNKIVLFVHLKVIKTGKLIAVA